MRYVKQCCIIFGITMVGELLNALLPLPIPAGVYGLFLLLLFLCTGALKLKDVEDAGGFLLDIMPLLFIPATVGLVENMELIGSILVPFAVITIVSTVIVMAVTGRTAQWIIRRSGKEHGAGGRQNRKKTGKEEEER